MKKENMTSLERSHSVKSNAKLTLICLLSSLTLTISILSVASIGHPMFESLKTVLYIASVVSALAFVLTLVLISKFTR